MNLRRTALDSYKFCRNKNVPVTTNYDWHGLDGVFLFGSDSNSNPMTFPVAGHLC